ncbi:MAG: CRISPR-associated endonuclease Cas2 [Thermofilaceae archaeon]|uniref:CRISPR-associated endonuclease Cas2 n=1 Tax=Desulfurococcus sp. TaxID=51678 RepID=UPI0031614DD9
MYVIVAFDISDERVRGRLRRFLRSLGLSMVNRSVYAGVGGQSVVEKIRERVDEIIGERDSVFIILVQEQEYMRAVLCTRVDCKRVEDVFFEIF